MKSTLKLLKDANDIIRTFHAVIERKGKDTNWDALGKDVNKVLKEQHKVMYPDQYSWISFKKQDPIVDNEKTIEVWTNYGLRLAVNKDSGLQVFGMGKESEFKDMFEVTHWRIIGAPK